MLANNQYDRYDKHIDKGQEIADLYSMYAWSSETLPYQHLIRMLKHESGSNNTLYQIACYVQWLSQDTGDEEYDSTRSEQTI